MTNTNDFRKYSYVYDTSYMLKNFDVSRSSAAPKRREREEQDTKTSLTLHENKERKSAKQIDVEEKLSAKKALALMFVAAIIIGMVGLTIHSFALKNELTREVSSMETQISLAQSENVSLHSRLDSMISVSMIDDYAVNELNMTKIKSNQIQYIDVNQYKQNRMNNIKNESPAAMTDFISNN